MNFNTINWLAIVVAALSAFMVGGLWYSNILFGKVWMADSDTGWLAITAFIQKEVQTTKPAPLFKCIDEF